MQKHWWVSQGLAAKGSTLSQWKLSYFIPAYPLVNTTTTLAMEPQNEGKSRVTPCPSHSRIKKKKRCEGQNCLVGKVCQQDKEGSGSLLGLRLSWIDQLNDPVELAVSCFHRWGSSQHIPCGCSTSYVQTELSPLPFCSCTHLRDPQATSPGSNWLCLHATSIVHILFTPAKEPVGQQGGAGTKKRGGTCHLKGSSAKSALSPSQFADSQCENRWEHPPSLPG